MGTKTALIFGAAMQPQWDYLAALRRSRPLVICADGGIACAKRAGFVPDIYVGDCDSGGAALSQGENHLLPAKKDVTDLEAAYDCAKAHGCTQLTLTACTGGRQDHHIAALQLLERAYGQGIAADLLDPGNRIVCVGKGEHCIRLDGYRYFSLLPIDERLTGVCIRHASYPLENAVVLRGSSLCVSNEAPDGEAELVIGSGRAWLVTSC